jgi:hypothetical protein
MCSEVLRRLLQWPGDRDQHGHGVRGPVCPEPNCHVRSPHAQGRALQSADGR